ncbi:tRNA pseudouridine(38-40) synthase TruA [Candidatus Litorirhabdus singularis]|uniref:tRNA pseudouridine(38-40) synthase TruA n=1 Tax=Candidatus Litorirhabdus singularis TaxID=2518993 RepID=UPI00243302A2|nr:tRNA pseudouridine(38-40) synthase TruA [Candidatus Litorirhabdus singularis]
MNRRSAPSSTTSITPLFSPLSNEDIAAGRRVALTVEYDGSHYCGWQLQQSGVSTVQEVLEAALGSIAAAPIRVACAGRTDTGVHATAQVVHFESPASRSAKAWVMGVNANLPDSVAVRSAQAVEDDFHARFSATSRRYRYCILNTQVRSALSPAQLTRVRYPLQAELMDVAAQELLGECDFSSFRAASCQSSTPMRHIDFIRVQRLGDLVIVDIQANAFLHHMVRNIVGALILVGRGRMSATELAQLLLLRDRTQAPETAPPNGLYLVGVNYPERFGLPVLAPGPWFIAGQ